MRCPSLSRVIVIVAVLALSGCIRPGGPNDLRLQLSTEADVVLDKQVGITMTRTAIMLARWGTRISGHSGEIPLKGVRRIEVGVYEVERRGVESRRPLPDLQLPGWHNVVRVREQDEEVFVLLRPDERDPDRIRSMLVVVAEDDEWVLVRIRGKLTKTVEQAIRLGLEHGNRGDLAEDVVRDYRRAADEDEVAGVIR